MAVTQDAAAVANRWSTGLSGATQKIQSGVEAVSTSPGQLAARQAQVWVQNTQAAQAKFQRNAAAVSLQAWQSATVQKGIPRIAAGATQAEPKVQAFMSSFLPFLQAQVNQLPARGNLSQNIQRAVAMITATSKFPGYQRPS